MQISRASVKIVEQTPRSVRLKVPRAKVTETCREVLAALAT